MARCSAQDENTLNIAIQDLPPPMQEVVKNIHKYGKIDDKRGIRYSKRWILECLFLSIKSRKAYLHLRSNNILVLPTLQTLKNYLKGMKPQYGFDPHVFNMLKKKSSSMKPEERRGKMFEIYMKLLIQYKSFVRKFMRN